MASITSYLKFINDYNENLSKYEQRTPKVGALNAFYKDTLMIPGGSGIITSEDLQGISKNGYSPNGMAIAVTDYQGITIQTTPVVTCEATTPTGDTALVDVSYSNISFDLKIEVGQYANDYVSLDSAFAKALKARKDAVLLSLNSLCLARLEADKNIVIAPNTLAYWADGGGSFQVGAADQDDYFNNLRMAMAKMNYEGPWRYIGNPEVYAQIVNKQFAQGTGNAVNTNYQFTGDPIINLQNTNVLGADFDWNLDNQLVNGAGVNNTGFAIPTGSLAIISSVDNGVYPMSGTTDRGKAGEYSTATLPGLEGIDFGLRFVSDCVDDGRTQISGGPEAGPVDMWQFKTRIATVTPYNSDTATREGAINKFEVIP